ncbi:PH domain-containing protein [Humibacter ginsenosidimutans]|uniref:PH domain-containing protein n=1 Tax=Humibacter ginsenosidimutans TaxID=2599293 RepID=A0A5B8M882_9MICO|nr:PH domain-containing protein [Humibacter ginsenosidimutans]QDZ16409.1 PH domain-containing protein [Humibacter ginsenosidimutans]
MALTDGYRVPPTERVVARLRQHARRMVWPSLALIAVCAAAGYFGSAFPGWVGAVVWVGAGVLSVLLFLLPLLEWMTTRYTVTTRRLIVRSGLFVRERRELLHSHGYTVTLRTSWLQRIFRTGTITVGAMDQKTVARLRDVPRAAVVTEALHDLMENSQRSYPPGWTTGSAPAVDGTQPNGAQRA